MIDSTIAHSMTEPTQQDDPTCTNVICEKIVKAMEETEAKSPWKQIESNPRNVLHQELYQRMLAAKEQARKKLQALQSPDTVTATTATSSAQSSHQIISANSSCSSPQRGPSVTGSCGTLVSKRIAELYHRQITKMRARPTNESMEKEIRDRNQYERQIQDCTFQPQTNWGRKHAPKGNGKTSRLVMEPSKPVVRKNRKHKASRADPSEGHTPAQKLPNAMESFMETPFSSPKFPTKVIELSKEPPLPGEIVVESSHWESPLRDDDPTAFFGTFVVEKENDVPSEYGSV